MKRALALILPALVLLLAACGGTSNTPGGNGNGGDESSAPASTEASVDAQPSEGTGGGGGGTAGDLDSLVEALTPPNAAEQTKTTAEGGVFIGWESTDSVESLKSFYESAIPNAGMQIFSTTSAGGSYSWVFAENEGSSFGGSVTLAPSSSGGSGSTVIVTATSG